MNTQEQIIQRLEYLNDRRKYLTGEVTLLDSVITFWEEQLASHKVEQ